jgi:hypothetical protein
VSKTGKSKPCSSCQSKNLTPSEKMQEIIDTRSAVCFQSMDDFQKYALRGVFAGMTRGTNKIMRMLSYGWIVPQ